MKKSIADLHDSELKGKRVLVRVDFNVPQDKQGNITVKVKGRDYFDLLWYLQQGVKPNLSCIEGIETMKGLKEKLLAMVSRIDSQSIHLDLEALIADANFVNNLSRNMKAILEREISEKL